MTNLVFSDNLSLMIGARMEDSTQEVTSSGEKTEIVSDEVLPALTATYKIGEDMQIRAGYGKTVSRPDFREFATIRYQDPENADSVMGNSDLTYTTIQNFDLRWEWYMSAVETFSVALFSKYFENPIETTLTASDTPVTTFKNAKEATLYGAEIDFRKNLEFLNPKLELFSLSGNLALIESEVKIREEDLSVLTTNNREMQGQSPYVINMQLSYDDVDDGTSLNLAYNRFGERIRRLGQQKQADHYEQPFDQVDFVAQKSLDEAWKLKFKIGNLLDDKVVWKQDGEVTREYKKGRSYSFGFDWKY
jgi:TonB-dependent receptor